MTENTAQLSPTQRRALRAAAHHLNPVVSISQKGLTPSVLAEIDRCLKAHELIKLRLYGIEREVREALFIEICTALKCAEVQHIGNLLVLWRENPKDAAAQESALAGRRKSEPAITKKQAAARTEARNRKR
ncbi:YhbY family RNA-binding protein [Sulfuritalea hydrogenivorans]|uniref:RNA-binding protein n=1 Tax=Sulfuritalea hydrogenivorans sk43H TaxID=1223802 RepID=W0SD45_9PROT|nr:YhbY family RNA-binding protein [Sulfuritalea hydrogenivorans]MDK9713146.1 YhbY family RNA-binding protein [Sulfuritalea sp.]BAO29144.1 RNA-binding protein [Sulfuritalea hydrogenivorans sk43H]